MKYLLLITILIYNTSVWSCPSLIGKWKSSSRLSMEYNKNYSELKHNEIEFLTQLLGNGEVSYSNNQIHDHEIPRIKIKQDGKEFDVVSSELKYPYVIAYCDERMLEIEYIHPYLGTSKIKLNFIDENTYWKKIKHTPTAREYFQRTRNDT